MKTALTLFLLLLTPLISLRAESEIKMKALENRISKLEGAKDISMQPATPCAGPRVRSGMDIHLSADFIYWTMRLDSLTYAKTGFGDIINNISPSKGDVQSVDWSWDPGFKAGLGWNFCHGCWDLLLQYTWLYTNVDETKHSQCMQPGFIIRTASPEQFGRAKSHFDLHYQVGDLELGRNYFVSQSLKLRPFVGAKGTWQKQDYKVFYDRPLPMQNLTNYRAHFDHSIYGIGMRAGLNTSWQFFKSFSLYGNIALTGMWLHYDTERKDTYDGEQIAETTALNIQDHLRLIKPVLEFAIGLRAETYFSCGRYHILFQAGWESQIWINQTLYISVDNHYDRFDLNLQGLTAKLRFDF